MIRSLCALLGALLCAATVSVQAAPLSIVAAENFYGDVAAQIGGPDVKVTSIISAPAQDPHAFEATPAAARALDGADLVICNGANYDPWIERLLANAPAAHRSVIVVADLMHRKPGDNPHLWYDPKAILTVAAKIADALSARDPANAERYRLRLKAFYDSFAAVTARIEGMRSKYAGTPVTATEPIFDEMARALGLDMRNTRFQLAVMNGTEPAARDLAALQEDLTHRRVRLLLYNNQVSDALTARLRAIAQAAKVPVVGVSETEPPGKTFQQWIAAELDAVDKALGSGA